MADAGRAAKIAGEGDDRQVRRQTQTCQRLAYRARRGSRGRLFCSIIPDCTCFVLFALTLETPNMIFCEAICRTIACCACARCQ